jgi:hypothetical protein
MMSQSMYDAADVRFDEFDEDEDDDDDDDL